MKDLRATFLPKFVALALLRVRRALEIVGAREHARAALVVGDLHALAGEAGLLMVADVLEKARDAETAAKKFAASGAEADAEALLSLLRALEAGLSRLEARP